MCGLYVWIICVDYMCGLYVWIICVDYMCGLYVWIVCVDFVVYLCVSANYIMIYKTFCLVHVFLLEFYWLAGGFI